MFKKKLTQLSVFNMYVNSNDFISSLYDIYCALVNNKSFEKGYESDAFKVWSYEHNYYILDKSTGIIVTWYKLLGWQAACNIELIDNIWLEIIDRLFADLNAHNIHVELTEV